MPDEPNKTTVHLPSSGQATVTGPATVEPEAGGSVSVAGWYRSFEKYGFAGLVAFLFGWSFLSSDWRYNNLLSQMEEDARQHHATIEKLSSKFDKQLQDLQDRADKRDEKTRERIWSVLADVRQNVKQILQAMGVFPFDGWLGPPKGGK